MLVVQLNSQVFQANKVLRSRHLISISLDEHGNIKQPFLITCFLIGSYFQVLRGHFHEFIKMKYYFPAGVCFQV